MHFLQVHGLTVGHIGLQQDSANTNTSLKALISCCLISCWLDVMVGPFDGTWTLKESGKCTEAEKIQGGTL